MNLTTKLINASRKEVKFLTDTIENLKLINKRIQKSKSDLNVKINVIENSISELDKQEKLNSTMINNLNLIFKK